MISRAVSGLGVLIGLCLIPLPRRLQCELVGHDPSWVHAVAIGVLDAPVCRRCHKPLRSS